MEQNELFLALVSGGVLKRLAKQFHEGDKLSAVQLESGIEAAKAEFLLKVVFNRRISLNMVIDLVAKLEIPYEIPEDPSQASHK